MKYLWLIVTFCTIFSQHALAIFYSDYLSHLGTKSPYRLIENKNDAHVVYGGCSAIKIWMVTRHGSRYPSKEVIQLMQNNLTGIQHEILQNYENGEESDLDMLTIENIQNWKPPIIDLTEEKYLVPEGEEEMIGLAERMSSRFPEVLAKIYSNTSYKFQFTRTQRTNASAHAFATGLFGRRTAKEIWYPDPLSRDPILRFYKLCTKWRQTIKKNLTAVYERIKFQDDEYVSEVLITISYKLGFQRTLKFDEVMLMYTACAFETSWYKGKLSPWCSILTTEALMVMEYAEDLKYYWIDGYGYSLTYKQACPIIKDLVDNFNSSETYPKAVLYFTHSGTMLKMYSHLGLYKDKDTLRHDNYKKQAKRLWRVSKIDTFASNLAFVLFRCGGELKILLLHQEKIVLIPGCDDELCDFDIFMENFNDSINNCQFDEMCQV